MSRIQAGADHLKKRGPEVEGVAVTYRRGASSLAMFAVLGSSLLRVTENNGTVHTVRTDRDVLISRADMGAFSLPIEGDKIDIVFGAITERFTVAPIGSEPAWRFRDPGKTLLRIHTKSLGTV